MGSAIESYSTDTRNTWNQYTLYRTGLDTLLFYSLISWPDLQIEIPRLTTPPQSLSVPFSLFLQRADGGLMGAREELGAMGIFPWDSATYAFNHLRGRFLWYPPSSSSICGGGGSLSLLSNPCVFKIETWASTGYINGPVWEPESPDIVPDYRWVQAQKSMISSEILIFTTCNKKNRTY